MPKWPNARSDQRIHVANAKFTTCNADNPHFHFHLKRAIMIPGKKVVSGPFYLKFRKIPTPLALPFGWFPTPPEKRSQGLLMPGYGNGGALGFFLKDLGYYMPIGEYADTRLTGDIYTAVALGHFGAVPIIAYATAQAAI
jgi:lipopolysaccharide assembly outer membrane protein LptD (OstA)